MMETKIKWNQGDGYITASYNGSGDGAVVVTSDVNNGDERQQYIMVETEDKSVSIPVLVVQKGGGVVETYTRLTYIECNGQQYINTGYVVQEDDVIEMYFITTSTSSEDKAMFGVAESGNGIWATIYSNTAYIRFGSTESVKISNAILRYKLTLKKGSAVFDDSSNVPAFTGMPTIPLYLFASNNNNNTVNMYGYCRSMGFKISKNSGEVVVDMKPCKRDSDGKIGMLDIISGTFYVSEGDADFIGGNEVRVTEDYEIIDRVYFNKNKAFNTGYLGNNTTYIDVMFQRTNTSADAYLFGLTQGNRLTGYLSSSSSYWRYGNANPAFSLGTQKIYKAVVTPGKTTIDSTSKTFTVNEFETSDPIPVGGYKSGINPVTKHYIGYIYYFRMRYGDTLLLDWYPCKRLSDGVEGFWDCVTQKFIEPI